MGFRSCAAAAAAAVGMTQRVQVGGVGHCCEGSVTMGLPGLFVLYYLFCMVGDYFQSCILGVLLPQL